MDKYCLIWGEERVRTRYVLACGLQPVPPKASEAVVGIRWVALTKTSHVGSYAKSTCLFVGRQPTFFH